MALLRITLAVMAIVVAVYVVALFPATASAATAYMVGDDDGWDTGVDYSAWVEDKGFLVGDTLGIVLRWHSTHDIGVRMIELINYMSLQSLCTL
jgi:hypothetical protein